MCTEGWFCSTEGYCERGAASDASGEVCGNGEDDDGDGKVDCQDLDCGAASCDDRNPCTEDICPVDGVCENEPRRLMPSCGPGCTCSESGVPEEVSCFDGLDNDGDDAIDCSDPDCTEMCQ